MTATDLRPVLLQETLPTSWRTERRARVRREPALVSLALLIIAVAHSVNLAGWPRWFDDEGTYYSQAWAVQNLGSLAPYTYWYDHPPAGWLQLAAFTWLPDLLVDGNSALLSGRIVMVGYTLVSGGLLYMLARRLHLAPGWALTAMLVWALNPLVLFQARQVLLDSVALPWLIGAFVLALNRRRNLGLHMAAGLCFAVAVLTKETMLVFAPAVVYAVWQSAYRPTRSFAVVGFAMVTALTGAMYLLFALIRDELFPSSDRVSLWNALSFQLVDREGTGFLLDGGAQPSGSYDTLVVWLQHGPVLLVAGIAAGVLALAVRRLRAVGLAVVIAVLVALRPDGYLPPMYVIAVLPFLALAVVAMLDIAWRHVAPLRGRVLRVAAPVALLVAVAASLPVAGWASTYRTAWTADTNDVHAAALRQADLLPADARIAVDNTYWNDLVGKGRERERIVWFYKIDADAPVLEDLGNDARNLDYLFWTPYMAENAGPLVEDAYQHSVPVWTSGVGAERVEIRKVLRTGQGSMQTSARATR